jgi:hypothetical protein
LLNPTNCQTKVAIIPLTIGITDKKLTFVPMFKKAFFIAFISIFLVQCSNKLDILAPYKESVAVYGLLNQTDSVQYIRVQRVYLGEGNALTMAQNQDSCYFKPGELTVKLVRFKDGAQIPVDSPYTASSTINAITLTEANIQLNPGVFNTNQLLYKTTHKLYDQGTPANITYQLLIHNNKTGKDFSSNPVGLIGDFKSGLGHYLTAHPPCVVLQSNPPHSVLTPTPNVAIVPSANGVVVCKFNSPVNASVCGMSLRFFYSEFASSTGTPIHKFIDIGLGFQYLGSPAGGEMVDLTFGGDGMLSDIANAIPVDPAVDHRTADSVYFVLNGAGYDIALYNQVNSSTSLSQSRPTYGNINGGVGIFSSRKEYSLVKNISQSSIDRLSQDPKTCPLHFYDYSGHKSVNCP